MYDLVEWVAVFLGVTVQVACTALTATSIIPWPESRGSWTALCLLRHYTAPKEKTTFLMVERVFPNLPQDQQALLYTRVQLIGLWVRTGNATYMWIWLLCSGLRCALTPPWSLTPGVSLAFIRRVHVRRHAATL